MPARILIVEDDQIIAADLRLKVQGIGHEVIGIAISGEEAIGLAERCKPDLVLMDIQLDTAMDGLEAARIIQERTGASIIFVPDRGEPVCVGIRQRPEQQRVHHAENRRVGADADRERGHDDDGQRRVFAQHPDGIAEIL